jgi:hypothetical protein
MGNSNDQQILIWKRKGGNISSSSQGGGRKFGQYPGYWEGDWNDIRSFAVTGDAIYYRSYSSEEYKDYLRQCDDRNKC